MLSAIIKQKLESINEWYEDDGQSEWIRVHCLNPEHDDKHPSAGINKETGLHHCFSCGYNFKFIDDGDGDNADLLWQAKYAQLSKRSSTKVASIQEAFDERDDRAKRIILPTGTPIDREWRGISQELMNKAKAFYCEVGKFRGRYVFPVYEDGKLMGYDARMVDATARVQGAKWLRPKGMPVRDIIYPFDIIREMPHDTLVICEGVLDALSYIQMGQAAIASFGLTPPSEVRINKLLSLGVRKIVLAFDNDKAGIEGTMKLYPTYSEWFEIGTIPLVDKIKSSGYKDANEYLCR